MLVRQQCRRARCCLHCRVGRARAEGGGEGGCVGGGGVGRGRGGGGGGGGGVGGGWGLMVRCWGRKVEGRVEVGEGVTVIGVLMVPEHGN